MLYPKINLFTKEVLKRFVIKHEYIITVRPQSIFHQHI